MKFFSLVRESWSRFLANNDFNLSAALAFYMIISIVPFFALVFIIAGIFIDVQLISQSIISVINTFLGGGLSNIFETVLLNSRLYQISTASLVGLIFLLVGATALVNHLQYGINIVWGTKQKKIRGKRKKIEKISKKRVKSLFIIFISVLLLIFFFFLSLLINLFSFLYVDYLQYFNYLLWFFFIVFLFSFLFKFLPEKRPRFTDVVYGSFVTSLFFVIGQILIGLYFMFIDVGSVFGAFGGIIVLLIWLYYTSAVFFFGAEFTYLSIKNKE
jgi:membrane protein